MKKDKDEQLDLAVCDKPSESEEEEEEMEVSDEGEDFDTAKSRNKRIAGRRQHTGRTKRRKVVIDSDSDNEGSDKEFNPEEISSDENSIEAYDSEVSDNDRDGPAKVPPPKQTQEKVIKPPPKDSFRNNQPEAPRREIFLRSGLI
ncbi:DNA mismatch repair protein Msh6-like [Tiliqua scincoides]|uniref:DNA mismatch repair protein Msh6-like n=1 Tax=Tiliqua scincoides TaxID=71010 RepID=UPI003461E2C4